MKAKLPRGHAGNVPCRPILSISESRHAVSGGGICANLTFDLTHKSEKDGQERKWDRRSARPLATIIPGIPSRG
jgi:hypothetical protein